MTAGAPAIAGNVVTTTDGDIWVSRDFIVAPATPAQIAKENRLTSEQAFDRIAAGTKLNLSQIQSNIEQARRESSQFFMLTLVFAISGFAVVCGGVILLYLGQVTAGILAAASGIIPEAAAALLFSKDRELRKTIESYHSHMLASQKQLTMIDVAETIIDPKERDKMKQRIIFSALGIKVD